MIIQRLFSLHIILVLSCVGYIIFGAYVFCYLEGQHLSKTKVKHLQYIDRDSKIYAKTLMELVEKNLYRLDDYNVENYQLKTSIYNKSDELESKLYKKKLDLVKYIQKISIKPFNNVIFFFIN